MFVQETFKKEDLDSTYDSDSDDQILIKTPSPERKEIVNLVDSD